MPAVTLHPFGPLRLTDAQDQPVAGLGRRGQAILVFLAMQPGKRAERARLADLLWSDRSEEQARASLRQELSVLRRVLGAEALEADRQAVWLASSAVKIAEGDGVFLDGFDLRSEGFEDWLREQRLAETTIETGKAPAATHEDPRPALAVLPFSELSADRKDMFADGVVEEITGALSRVRDFDVISRQSAFALRDASLPVPQMAERLGADYLVEGSVRRAGDRVRIAVQLVRGRDGHALWSARFDDQLDDLFDLQDRIAAQVAGQLSPNLRAAEIARAGTVVQDRTAYDLTLRAYPHFWAHSKSENDRAIALFRQALDRDASYVPAKGHLAWALAQNACYMWSDDPKATHEEALALGTEAEAQVGDHAPSLVALGAVASMSSPDPERAQWLIERALGLDPNNAWAWLRAGWNGFYAGRPEEGLTALDRAEMLSPLDPFHFNILLGRASCYRNLGDYDRAVALTREAMRAKPAITWAYRMLVGCLMLGGHEAEALKEAARFRAHYPHVTLQYLHLSIPRSGYGGQIPYIETFRSVGFPEA